MILINSLCKYYKQGSETVKALDNVSLKIDDNEFVAVVGKSGSGKSTLLHMIGCIDNATSGSVFFDEIDILQLPEKNISEFRQKNIGFVFQNYNLIPELNGEQNIMFPAMLLKTTVEPEYFNKLVSTLDIADRLTHLPSEMSGGQQQRIAIARAFINKPKMVLCDEPTGNLDSELSNNVMKLLKQIHEEFKITVILVTHDPDCAKMASRIIELNDGRIIV